MEIQEKVARCLCDDDQHGQDDDDDEASNDGLGGTGGGLGCGSKVLLTSSQTLTPTL